MAKRNTGRKKHSQSLLVGDELYTILKGANRANIKELEDSFGLCIEGKSSLTIRHDDQQALSRYVSFIKEDLLPKAQSIFDNAKKAYEAQDQAADRPLSSFRPTQQEISDFTAYFKKRLPEFISQSMATAQKSQNAQNLTPKFTKEASGKKGKSVAKGPIETASKIALKELEYRGPNEGQKQKAQHSAILDPDVDLVFSLGLTGSGKTYGSMYAALQMLARGDIEKIYVIRPYVPSGRHRMGDVPGGEAQKLAGLMKGVINNVNKMLDPECGLNYSALAQKGLIELQPMDKTRSLTFDNCVVIVTEAQNIDYDQQDLLQRIGENCTLILDGSLEQQDTIVAYPTLIDWVLRYADDPLTPFIYYNQDEDIVRSPQSLRHVLAHKKQMPEGYVDYREHTPEYKRGGPLIDAVRNNGALANKAAAQACKRTLEQYSAAPKPNSTARVLRF